MPLLAKKPSAQRLGNAPIDAAPVVQAARYQNRPIPIAAEPSTTKSILRKGSRINEAAWHELQDAKSRLLFTRQEYNKLSTLVYRSAYLENRVDLE